MANNQQLDEKSTLHLREKNLLSENEFAYKSGDLIIAENALTGEKRIVGQAAMLSEANRRILKG